MERIVRMRVRNTGSHTLLYPICAYHHGATAWCHHVGQFAAAPLGAADRRREARLKPHGIVTFDLRVTADLGNDGLALPYRQIDRQRHTREAVAMIQVCEIARGLVPCFPTNDLVEREL